MDPDLVSSVRLEVLQEAMRSGRVLGAAVVAGRLTRPVAEVIEAFRQLAEAHIYVLDPGQPSQLRMANPFSAVAAGFGVEVGGRQYQGNCVWDALGIVSLLGGTGVVETACPDCADPLRLEVAQRRLAPTDSVVHFGVPARHWWDDIVYT